MRTALVLSPSEPRDPIAEEALHPFHSYRDALLRQLGLHVRRVDYMELDELPRILRESRADVAFVCTSWQWAQGKTVETFRHLRPAQTAGPRIVYLDTFDQSSSPFFGILPYVDLYVKKQLLRDRQQYLRRFETGYIFGAFARESLGLPANDWHFGSVVESPELLDKLRVGWNLGTAAHLTKCLRLFRKGTYGDLSTRPIDVQYRVGLAPEEDAGLYYNAHRISLAHELGTLQGRSVVNAAGSGARISADAFRRELGSCKLCVSAFGWGEVTYRDFEAVISEAALVKPEMSHVETEPDIYIPGKTYIPFAWDGSDLARVCEATLRNPEGAQEIARNARAVYQDWVESEAFVTIVGGILDTLEQPATGP